MTKINFDSNANVNVIVVDVYIENKEKQKKIRMALDTGATYIMIPWEVSESLGLEPEISKERIETITASGVEKVPLVELPLIRVGKTEVKSAKAMVHDLPAKSYVDGLLGLNFLRNFELYINFKGGYFEIK